MLESIFRDEIVVFSPEVRAKSGAQVLITRLRHVSLPGERTVYDICRMILYVLQCALKDPRTQENGLILIGDFNGAGISNIYPSVPKTVLPMLVGTFPINLKGMDLWNAPFFAKPVSAIVGAILSN